jgi:hypothetical protein
MPVRRNIHVSAVPVHVLGMLTCGKKTLRRASKPESGKDLRTEVVDRVRARPLLEEHDQAGDETPEHHRSRFPHLLELLPKRKVVASSKVHLDFVKCSDYGWVIRYRACNICKRFRCLLVFAMLSQPSRRLGLEQHKSKEEHSRYDPEVENKHQSEAFERHMENDALHDKRNSPLPVTIRNVLLGAIVDPDLSSREKTRQPKKIRGTK